MSRYLETSRPKRLRVAATGFATAVTLGIVVVAGVVTANIPAFAAMEDGPTGFTNRPDVMKAPVELFHEDFENIDKAGPIIPLVNYVSVNGQSYQAEGPWADPYVACNGFVSSASNDMGAACNDSTDSQGGLANLADVLGQVNDSDPRENAVISAYTSGQPYASGLVMFETDGETIPLPTANRFVTFSVNVAAVSCWAAQPQLRFSVLADGTETPISGADAINPCTDSRATAYRPSNQPDHDPVFLAGEFASGGSFLTDGSPIGLVMRNDSGATAGNDAAFDDIRLLDVTPHLNKEFLPERVPVGGTSTLTFTVTNTSEAASKEGWAFTDTLRDGLRFADDPNLGGTCDANVALSEVGGNSVVAVDQGVLATGTESCTVSVDVTSETPRGSDPSPVTYINNIDDMSNVIGLDATNETPVEFYSEPQLSITKTSDATADTRIGDTVTYSVTATNIGSGDYTEEIPAVVFDDLADVLDDAEYNDDAETSREGDLSYAAPLLGWSGALPVDESVTVTYTVTLGAVGDRVVRNVAWAPEDPENLETPVCAPPTDEGVDPVTGEACAETEALLPALEIAKAVSVTEITQIGEEVTYTVTVTNPGPGVYTESAPATMTDDLSDVLDDADFVGEAVASTGAASLNGTTLNWEGALAAGEAATVTYTVNYTANGDLMLRNAACVPVDEALDEPCASTDTPGSDKPLEAVNPVAPTLSTPECGVEAEVIMPETEGVTYTQARDGDVVTVTATADEGYVFEDGAVTEWSVTIPAVEDCPITPVDPVDEVVMTTAPTLSTPECGVEAEVIMPETEGVTYTQIRDGDVVTVTATADEGYVFEDGAVTEWSVTIPAVEDCPITPVDPVDEVVMTTAPTLSTPECGEEAVVTLPETAGVTYTQTRDGHVVTVTATADESYVLEDGAVSEWTLNIPAVEECPIDPIEEDALALTGASADLLLPIGAGALLLSGAALLLAMRKKQAGEGA